MDGDLYREKAIIAQKFQVFILAIRPKQNKNIHLNNSRNLVFARLQSIEVEKDCKKSSYGIKMGYKAFRKFEINYFLCL